MHIWGGDKGEFGWEDTVCLLGPCMCLGVGISERFGSGRDFVCSSLRIFSATCERENELKMYPPPCCQKHIKRDRPEGGAKGTPSTCLDESQ